MNITPNLSLKTYATITDASSILVYDYVSQVSGSFATENLGIIDIFSGSSASALEISASSIGLASSRVNNTSSAIIQIVPIIGDVDKTTGSFIFVCPSDLDGMNLFRAQAFLNASSNDGDYQFEVYNVTVSASMIESASPVLIVAGNLAGIPGTIKVGSEGVSTDDNLLIYTSSSPATAGQGLQFILEFITP